MPNIVSIEAICYSPSRAAELLGIGKSTLFNLLARGEIKAKKLGSRTLISASELARYVGMLPDAEFHAYDQGGEK